MTTSKTTRPRRSLIFMPGNKPEMFEKALGAGADIVTIDLEDAIAPPDKAAMYMGYYFVAIALGNLFGGLLSGQAYQRFANLETGNGRPDIMWMIFAGIAVMTAVALA